jgi:hypothetical protein
MIAWALWGCHTQILPTPPTLTHPKRQALFARCLATVDDAESFLRGWRPSGQHQARERVTGAFLSSPQAARPTSSAAWIEEGDVYIAEMQAATGLTFELGRTDGVEPMQMYSDDVDVVCRPLLCTLSVVFLPFFPPPSPLIPQSDVI